MKFRLNVDEEFKKIAPHISRSEYAELEKSIMSEGCHDPIIIWNGVIVDGHNRYVICRQEAAVLSCTQQRAKSLMGQVFLMHEKTLTLVSRLAFYYVCGVRKRWICVFDRWIRTLENNCGN